MAVETNNSEQAGSKEIEDRCELTFDGQFAATGLVDAEELVKSLNGWIAFLRRTAEFEISGSTSPDIGGNFVDFKAYVSAPRRGSLIIVILTYLATKALDGIIGNRADALFTSLRTQLWQFRRKIFSQYIAIKRRGGNADEIAAALKTLMEEAHDSRIDLDDNAMKRAAHELDSILKDATQVVGKSASEVFLTGPDHTKIEVKAAEKEIIHAPLQQKTMEQVVQVLPEEPPPPEGFTPGIVCFHRIHIDTGGATVSFKDPPEMIPLKKETAYIVDDNFHRPNDPYTSAQSARKPMRVFWRYVLTESGDKRLEITAGDLEVPPLFRDVASNRINARPVREPELPHGNDSLSET